LAESLERQVERLEKEIERLMQVSAKASIRSPINKWETE